jgi:zinc transporter, ZIP family
VGEAVLFGAVASAALVIGAVAGCFWVAPRPVLGALLAFASGALITALAFDLFEDAFEGGGAWRAGIGLFTGAAVFIAVDTWLDRRVERRASRGAALGLALLAAVTLDGLPENLALGVSLLGPAGGLTLLVAIFASNFPEALAGAMAMREGGRSVPFVVGLWTAAAVLLAAAVVFGWAALRDVGEETLAWPLSFAGGAVLASLADTLMPEAYRDAGPATAFATTLGFLLSFLVSAA